MTHIQPFGKSTEDQSSAYQQRVPEGFEKVHGSRFVACVTCGAVVLFNRVWTDRHRDWHEAQ